MHWLAVVAGSLLLQLMPLGQPGAERVKCGLACQGRQPRKLASTAPKTTMLQVPILACRWAAWEPAFLAQHTHQVRRRQAASSPDWTLHAAATRHVHTM